MRRYTQWLEVQAVTAQTKTDEELMALVAEGAEAQLEVLVKRYQNDIFRFCLHYVKDVERAKELSQETFIRVYVARARFDPGRKFRPWLLCIARNLCLNDLKRKKTVGMESLEDYASNAREDTGELMQAAPDGAEARLIEQERFAQLGRMLDGLDNESREIVMMRFFEKMSARDIAEVVESTEGAIRTRLHRILKSLRKEYSQLRELY